MFLFISFVGVGNKGKQLGFLCQEDMFKQKKDVQKKSYKNTMVSSKLSAFEIWRKSVALSAFLFDTFLLTKVADLKRGGRP